LLKGEASLYSFLLSGLLEEKAHWATIPHRQHGWGRNRVEPTFYYKASALTPKIIQVFQVADQGIALALSTPSTIRARQRKLSRQAKSEFGYWLKTDACFRKKNIGKPCMGKLYARIDEGALGIVDCYGSW